MSRSFLFVADELFKPGQDELAVLAVERGSGSLCLHPVEIVD